MRVWVELSPVLSFSLGDTQRKVFKGERGGRKIYGELFRVRQKGSSFFLGLLLSDSIIVCVKGMGRGVWIDYYSD